MGNDVVEFDRWSSSYEESWIQRYFDRLHELMLEVVAADARGINPSTILDVGCGTGRLLRRASVRWPSAQVIGVDPAHGMVEVAQKLMPSAMIHQGFAESLPLENGSVDLVLSSASMHHWRDSALGVREVARVLRRGGLFCLADICPPRWLAALFRSKAKSKRAISDLLMQAGFSIARQQKTFAGFVLVSVAEIDLKDQNSF